MSLLTQGNTAKLYCLNWIEQYSRDKPSVTLLDLGCGTAANFIPLLKQYRQIHYIGVEPSPADSERARQNTAGLNATIINTYAYDLYGKDIHEKCELVVSFSVFEHVYRRLDYLRAARACIRDDGYFLINYDAGHFVMPKNLRERTKNWLGPVLARLGRERYYQAFVRQAEFDSLCRQAGFQVLEVKSFNTRLKGVYKHVPPEAREAFMRRWLDLELWLNEQPIPYDDTKATTWGTRNYILRPTSS
ncbi:MAG: class I SAM-dependent methyltransferase [Chloroflexi bacterium]|nr:class I SAM-dependent methyltransferase [Chloroflexota bacterium]